MKYTKEQIIKICEENDVKFIRLQFTDILGQLKNVAITTRQLEKALENKCMFDGSSIEGFVRIEESDMYLYPDLDSFVIFPWRPQQGKVARLICDIYMPDGTPFEGDPRYRLRRMIKKAADMGLHFNVGPELEFFLFHTDEFGRPTTTSHDKSSYFDLGPIDLGENVRRDICMTLEDMGFEVEASHHEVAHAQHEIDFKYGEALATADNMMTFKLVVKTIAKRSGLHATFMPKPIFGINGSGMHINMSLSGDNGANVFCDDSDALGLSDTARQFIAGVMHHVKGMTAINNPLINSYKRLVPGYEAPCYIAWTACIRSALVRVPATRGPGTRVELRSPDPSANHYLVLACCLAAGLEGIRKKMAPPEPVNQNIFELSGEALQARRIENLPASLGEALAALRQDDLLRDVLGEHIFEKFIEAKSAEVQDYNLTVTQWELDRYLLTM